MRLAARVGGPTRRAAYVLPVLAGFGAFYLIGHKLGLSVGPEIGLFGFQVALLGDVAIGFAAALVVALLQAAVARARRPASAAARPARSGYGWRRRSSAAARLVARRHGHARARPVAVRARVEQGIGQPGDPHRERVVTGRDPRPAGRDDLVAGVVSKRARRVVGREEAAVGRQVAPDGRLTRRGDVTRDRVDRLDVSAVALRRAGVDHGERPEAGR